MPSPESIWRFRLRQYSQKFFTPLHEAEKLDPLYIMQALYEDQYNLGVAREELEDLIEILQKIKDPSYSKMSEQDMEDMVDAVINRELARAAKKKPPTLEAIAEATKVAAAKPKDNPNPPKSGSINFGSLQKLEGVDNKGKFED